MMIVSTPDPHAPKGDIGRLILDPTANARGLVRYFTVDGVRFAQSHTDAVTSPVTLAATLVLGVLPNNDDVRITCTERAKPALVKAACRVVIDSLQVRT